MKQPRRGLLRTGQHRRYSPPIHQELTTFASAAQLQRKYEGQQLQPTLFHDNFLQNKSDIFKISTKSEGDIQVFLLNGVKRKSRYSSQI